MAFVTLFFHSNDVKILTPAGIQTLPSCPETLHHELGQYLPEKWRLAPKTQTRSLWLLEPELPPVWQHYDWTRHHLDGQPFPQLTVVVRKARWPETPLLPTDRFYYHNAFKEHDFYPSLEPFIASSLLTRLPKKVDHLPPAEGSEWFFLAHGDENGLVGVNPELLDHPPQTVWLLACDHDGAMRRLAGTLLERGAQTVIYACGLLSAPEIEALVRYRLERPNLRPEAILTQLPDDLLSRSARLEIMGAVELDDSPVRDYNRAVWEEAHGRPSYLRLGDRRKDWEQLRNAWEKKQFWPETVKTLELEAWLLWLAEQYDGEWMERFLNRHPHARRCSELRQRAKAMRRLGAYPAAAQYLKQGFDQTKDDEERYDLHTLALQIATDLDLPQAAQAHMDESEPLCPPDRQLKESFKALDQRARIRMRQGDWISARQYLEDKYRQAGNLDKDGRGLRELAVLLAFGAWHYAAGDGPETEELDDWAQRVLSKVEPGISPQGNDTNLYLCRALAYYRWVRKQPVEPWLLQTLRDGCRHTDGGPAAQGVLACALHQSIENATIVQAFNALERGKYYLEAAAFAALLDGDYRQTRCLRLFNLFNQLRDKVVQHFPSWRQEADERGRREKEALDAPKSERCRRIVQEGILPL